MFERNKSPVDSLFALLARERDALVNGDMQILLSLSDCKAQLIEEIGTGQPFEKDQILALQDKIERNQALLKSALDGIRAVSGKMADLQRVRQGLDTYDRSGVKSRVRTNTKSKMEKRA